MGNREITLALIEVMQDQLETYKTLFNLGEQKTDVLVNGDLKKLNEITEIEQGLVLKLGKLEEERFDLVKQIAKLHNKDASEIKGDFLKSILEEKEAKTFAAIYDGLKDVLLKIEDQNRRNEKLIKNALDYINFSINLLTETRSSKANYGADGANAKDEAFHFIDKQA